MNALIITSVLNNAVKKNISSKNCKILQILLKNIFLARITSHRIWENRYIFQDISLFDKLYCFYLRNYNFLSLSALEKAACGVYGIPDRAKIV